MNLARRTLDMSLHLTHLLEERGFFVIAGLGGLIASLVVYAVLVNASLGLQIKLKDLSNGLNKIENENAKNQAILGKAPAPSGDLMDAGLSEVGNDFSYVHPNQIFVDASHLRP